MSVDRYVGRPWRDQARGPEAFDCWGLVMAASRSVFGVAVPELADSIAARRRWHLLQTLQPGAVLVLTNPKGHAYHVGLVIDERGHVLHTTDGGRARIEPIERMTAAAAAWGFYAWPA